MRNLTTFGRIIFAIPFAVFGINHFVYGKDMAGMVPAYVPGGVIWIYLIGAALLAAGIAILINRKARLAAILLALLLLVFIVTIHIPGLSNPQMMQMSMTNLLKDAGLLGGALVVAGTAKN